MVNYLGIGAVARRRTVRKRRLVPLRGLGRDCPSQNGHAAAQPSRPPRQRRSRARAGRPARRPLRLCCGVAQLGREASPSLPVRPNVRAPAPLDGFRGRAAKYGCMRRPWSRDRGVPALDITPLHRTGVRSISRGTASRTPVMTHRATGLPLSSATPRGRDRFRRDPASRSGYRRRANPGPRSRHSSASAPAMIGLIHVHTGDAGGFVRALGPSSGSKIEFQPLV